MGPYTAFLQPSKHIRMRTCWHCWRKGTFLIYHVHATTWGKHVPRDTFNLSYLVPVSEQLRLRLISAVGVWIMQLKGRHWRQLESGYISSYMSDFSTSHWWLLYFRRIDRCSLSDSTSVEREPMLVRLVRNWERTSSLGRMEGMLFQRLPRFDNGGPSNGLILVISI